MLAQRLPTILPPLSRAEAIEVTRVQSITGRLAGEGLIRRRPFRAPHHTITAAGLVGGAQRSWDEPPASMLVWPSDRRG
jgi:magnesium chelatase family protein